MNIMDKKILDACMEWVSRFNAIPTSAVEIIQTHEAEGFRLVAGEYSLDTASGLPMWGTMWTFDESLDEEFFRGNLHLMEECGFTVFESESLGLVFGIDGAGYNFYENHWIPLYKARGLRWHEKVG